jgi:transcriptional regulator with XRE-family HTH domain
MYINEQRIEDELAFIRSERVRLQEQIECFNTREASLIDFLNRAREYAAETVVTSLNGSKPLAVKPGHLRPVAKNTIGGKARARRLALGLSQQALANQVGCSNETVSSLELNRSGIGAGMKSRLLTALGLTDTGQVADTVRPVRVSNAVQPNKQHTIVAQAVAAAFAAGDIVTGREAFERIGDQVRLKMPENASKFSPTHMIANMLMLEAREGENGILERVSSGHYRVRENAAEIVQKRLASAQTEA